MANYMRVAKKQKPTNPNWGKSISLTALHEQQACEFDNVVDKLNLLPEQFESSQVLYDWVKKNYRQRYVPEYLLVLWNLIPTFEE